MPVKTKKQIDESLIPQNIEAEEAILGAVLVNPACLAKVSDFLQASYFYKPAHRYIYEAMIELFNNNDNIDIVSVSDVLSYNSKLETVGGRAFINDLSYKTITTSNIEYYARIVQEKAIKRSLINAGSEIVSFGYDMNPIDESLENAEHTSRLPKEERPRAPRLQLDSSEAATIFVGIGRNRRVYPRDLVGLLVSVAKIDRERIGDIRVLANYSFIQLYTEDAEKVISALNGYDYRGRKLTVNLSKPKDENLGENQSDEVEFEKKENAVVTQTEAKSPETPNAEKTSSADSVPSANDKPFSQTTDDGQVKSHFGDGATY